MHNRERASRKNLITSQSLYTKVVCCWTKFVHLLGNKFSSRWAKKKKKLSLKMLWLWLWLALLLTASSSGFKCQLGPFFMEFVCSPHAYMGSLWVLPFPCIIQNQHFLLIVDSKLILAGNVRVRSCFSHFYLRWSCDGLVTCTECTLRPAQRQPTSAEDGMMLDECLYNSRVCVPVC